MLGASELRCSGKGMVSYEEKERRYCNRIIRNRVNRWNYFILNGNPKNCRSNRYIMDDYIGSVPGADYRYCNFNYRRAKGELTHDDSDDKKGSTEGNLQSR